MHYTMAYRAPEGERGEKGGLGNRIKLDPQVVILREGRGTCVGVDAYVNLVEERESIAI